MSPQQRLDSLFDLLRFPSISTDPLHAADVRACADWLAAKLSSAGLDTAIHPTARHPVIVTKNSHRPGRPTVLIYGHYDVQPVDPEILWTVTKPFEPKVVDGVIFARGATDNKGQLFAHTLGLLTALESGELPVNVTVLFEGEEEIGSPNLAPFLVEHRDLLRCDVVAISDTGMVAPGVGTFTYGLRGIACLEVLATGPSKDLHSGIWGGAVANPATAIGKVAASLHDASGRIAIPGLADKVKPLAPWEREAWAKLPDSEPETLAMTGSPELFGEAGFSDLERRWARPTAEVNGIGGGYQGEGSKTVIPAEAFLKLSFRLVPDQDPQEVLDLAEKHFQSLQIPGIRLHIKRGHSGPPYLTDPNSGFGKAAQKALARTFPDHPVALIREGGSIPIVQAFKDILGADSLLLGLALPDCQIHSPNENFPVANFEAGIRLNQILLQEIAQA